jgi:2'-5' RNA ligase
MPRRLFIAIDLPKQVGWNLARRLEQPPRGVRPVRPGQMHLTLHFLGDVADEARAVLPAALARVTFEPFTIAIRGTGMFPPRGRPTVLWAGVTDSVPLAALHGGIGVALESCGLAIERRPYVPHVTLARLTPAVSRVWTGRLLGESAGLHVDAIPVDRFTLYRSDRRDGATEHTAEARFPPTRAEQGPAS